MGGKGNEVGWEEVVLYGEEEFEVVVICWFEVMSGVVVCSVSLEWFVCVVVRGRVLMSWRWCGFCRICGIVRYVE